MHKNINQPTTLVMKPSTPYDAMGGEQALLLLVDRFYFFIETLPNAQEVRSLHQSDLSSAKEKLYKFLSGWLGGPNLYIDEFGHPMLRARHLPFVIGGGERDQWMLCMEKALSEVAMDSTLRVHIHHALQQLATHMINKMPA